MLRNRWPNQIGIGGRMLSESVAGYRRIAQAFFRLDDYVARFMASAASWRFNVGHDAGGVKAALTEMVAATGLRDAYVAM
ncbi:MAG: hypothetical protein MJH10_17895, partial [Epibacterium sp.]|nr:hypothetical protein [Epibacterium sp.]NQX75368.1 hypothetical protein [Epibacterium sp.]